MSQLPPESPGTDSGRTPGGLGDPWSIVAYLLSGMLVWGGAGWLLDRWLGTSFLVLVGLLLGTALATYLIYVRLGSS
ncbi:MAG: AtpZ/AtpI family protein [Actinomycetota bacterium]|nr:AtpZ/AtpI family protein [Actinomycetota bacterium]